MIKDVILASKSSARKKLLESKGINIVKIIPSNIDEKIKYPSNLELSIEEIAREKLEKVKINNLDTNYPIIACDTIVVLDSKIYGKPKDRNDAKNMLKTLSNNTHKVISGFAIYIPKKKINITGYDIAKVKFEKVDDNIIEKYLDVNDFQNCAGSYRLQNLPKDFKMQYFGDYSTIVGLPFSKIFDILNMLSV